MDNWIKTKKEKPESKRRVLICTQFEADVWNKSASGFVKEMKQNIAIAYYIAPRSVLTSDWWFEDSSEFLNDYDEQEDLEWVMEGWYEYCEGSEVDYQIPDEVTHWMPLPDKPEMRFYLSKVDLSVFETNNNNALDSEEMNIKIKGE